ncbi:hypothetical protein [Ralstonia phage RP31]|uniref:DUF7448 domain-containing protein n=2 Tax=Ripduovirus RP12 TaxID=2560700 RepID=A0A1L7N0Y4_9CAUD|nr:hypothetical protein FDH28_gp254 [Ralstonia phage RP12]BAW19141.1 hypothetical protein [Ralstonia phage RP12]BAW19427.1 hypothetical protein [Ralstonia phage RP31]
MNAINVNVLDDLLGQVMVNVEHIEVDGEDELVFTLQDGRKYVFCHYQDCCESVNIESIVGDLQDLVGSPLLMAEEIEHESEEDTRWGESSTWTFYKFATLKGYVDVRWLGTSSGYYSEAVHHGWRSK